jgi:Neuraminidase (sialidase)
MYQLTRRRVLLNGMGAACAGVVTLSGVSAQQDQAAGEQKPASSRFTVSEVRTISHQDTVYHGWPTLTRRANGELLVVFSGGREHHVCPFGRVDLIRSLDDGASWSFARTILDGPLDDRDAGILETSQGTLLATTFTSLAYEPILKKAEAAADTGKPTMSEQQLIRWQAAAGRLRDSERAKQLGTWMIRSTDGGLSWSPAYDCLVDSPHGPIQLSDGRLLYAGVQLWTEDRRVGVAVSEDDGQSWKWLAEIPARDGDDHRNYHELHAVECADGRIVVQIRNHNSSNRGETLQTHSTDGGQTWARPYAIGVWGLPPHLLKLADNRLLMTYGHRRKPLGNQARTSDDNGRTWSPEMVVYGDGVSSDLGYPSTVEISPGQLVTVWYERLSNSPYAQLRMARWQLHS